MCFIDLFCNMRNSLLFKIINFDILLLLCYYKPQYYKRDVSEQKQNQSRSPNMVPFDVRYRFLLVFYSNFVPKFLRYWTCKYSDLETQVRGHSRSSEPTRTCRSTTYDCVLTFHSDHGPISYRFRDKQ